MRAKGLGRLAVAFWIACLTLAGAWAQSDLETRAKRLEGKIMAPCCMANPVSDHFSGAADDIRREIRVLLREGKTDREILDFFVQKHGEQILALPRAEGFNLAAYLLPGAALLSGALGLFLVLRKWQRKAAAAGPGDEPLDEAGSSAVDPEMLARIEREVRERS